MVLRTTLIKSCDTVFDGFAYREWQRDGGLRPTGTPRESFVGMAKSFGFGTRTGIDLPSEAAGSIVSRASRIVDYAQHKADYCAGAKNPTLSDYRRQIEDANWVAGGP